MKNTRFKILCLFLPALLLASFHVNSQDTRKWKHWSVGASFIMTTGHNDNPRGKGDYSNYKGAEIEGSYKVRLYRSLFLRPDVSFHYAVHGKDRDLIGGSIHDKGRIREWGMGIGLPFGINLPVKGVSFDFETGPTSTIYFWQKFILSLSGVKYVDSHGNPVPKYRDFESNRFVLRWMLGVRFNFWHDRLFVKLNYNFPVTNTWKDEWETIRGQNVFTVGLGCNF